MVSARLVRWSGLAAILGGVLWTLKGMLGWVVPGRGTSLEQVYGVLFLAGVFLFGLGLVGPVIRLAGRSVRVGLPGVLPACLVAIAAAVIPGVLVVLGIVLFRGKALPPPWRALPLAIGVLYPLLFAAGGYFRDAGFSWYHIELPVVALGLAWVWLGCALWSDERGQPSTTSATDLPGPSAPSYSSGQKS